MKKQIKQIGKLLLDELYEGIYLVDYKHKIILPQTFFTEGILIYCDCINVMRYIDLGTQICLEEGEWITLQHGEYAIIAEGKYYPTIYHFINENKNLAEKMSWVDNQEIMNVSKTE